MKLNEWLMQCRDALSTIAIRGTEQKQIAEDACYALSFLFHHEKKTRNDAFEALTYHCHLNSSALHLVRSAIDYLARHEVDEDIRCKAVRWIGTCFGETRDARQLSFLSAVVHDATISKLTRASAYRSLLIVLGDVRGLTYVATDETQFPNDVDWATVNPWQKGVGNVPGNDRKKGIQD